MKQYDKTPIVFHFVNIASFRATIETVKELKLDSGWEHPIKVEKYGVLNDEYKVTLGDQTSTDEFKKLCLANVVHPLRGWPV